LEANWNNILRISSNSSENYVGAYGRIFALFFNNGYFFQYTFADEISSNHVAQIYSMSLNKW